jgi:hypothetical protein
MATDEIRDITDRYEAPEYYEGDSSRWTLERADRPIRAIVVHHTAGWYGRALGGTATSQREIEQIDALAKDHRTRFGIGPGYHYLVFPSGRVYAAGRWDTHRAHTTGRNPETGEYWNVDAIGICAFGNYEESTPSDALVTALTNTVEQVRTLAGAHVRMYGHGATPTVNALGAPQPQATACPGRHLLAQFARVDLPPAVSLVEGAVHHLQDAQQRLQAALVLLTVEF